VCKEAWRQKITGKIQKRVSEWKKFLEYSAAIQCANLHYFRGYVMIAWALRKIKSLFLRQNEGGMEKDGGQMEERWRTDGGEMDVI